MASATVWVRLRVPSLQVARRDLELETAISKLVKKLKQFELLSDRGLRNGKRPGRLD
jgi:hypothetical protein